jgi:hypothetical protein
MNLFRLIKRWFNVSSDSKESEGWLSKLLMVRKIDTGKESHSRLLSDTELVYEMQSISNLYFIIISLIVCPFST